jgi:hypothetical protein
VAANDRGFTRKQKVHAGGSGTWPRLHRLQEVKDPCRDHIHHLSGRQADAGPVWPVVVQKAPCQPARRSADILHGLAEGLLKRSLHEGMTEAKVAVAQIHAYLRKGSGGAEQCHAPAGQPTMLVDALPPAKELIADRGNDNNGFRAALLANDITLHPAA